jgi:hypothetical protein
VDRPIDPKRLRSLPKTGWKNRAARFLYSLSRKPAASEFLGYQTKTRLRLPFEDEWYVYWGGRSVAQNRHAVARDQRFAYDFLILKEGRSFVETGDTNEDYYCFGLPVVAPGAGVVVGVAGDLKENLPGIMSPQQPLGNHVILDHENGEFSFLAHLKKDSVRVTLGQQVAAGTLLGACGNSGNSSEPHLHFHLQTTSILFHGEGLPAFFRGYSAGGKIIARGEPMARQRIRHVR